MKNVFLSIISVPCTVFFKKGKISSEKQAKNTAAKQEHSKKKLANKNVLNEDLP